VEEPFVAARARGLGRVEVQAQTVSQPGGVLLTEGDDISEGVQRPCLRPTVAGLSCQGEPLFG
jgi:hypothetical protein